MFLVYMIKNYILKSTFQIRQVKFKYTFHETKLPVLCYAIHNDSNDTYNDNKMSDDAEVEVQK